MYDGGKHCGLYRISNIGEIWTTIAKLPGQYNATFFILQPMSCTRGACLGSHVCQWQTDNDHADTSDSTQLFQKAEKYLKEFYRDKNRYSQVLNTRYERINDPRENFHN